jgi:N-acetyl-gamma-glutamyl-phosphate reductase
MLRSAVVGASGYSGAELVDLLAGHPAVELASVHADRAAGRRWGDLHPARRHRFDAVLETTDPDALAGLDVVFLALPGDASAPIADALLGRVGCLVDLSGALRLPDATTYRRWYGHDHPAPHLLGRAVYGLPELDDGGLRDARLVACAGCYATVTQLAAAPLLAAGVARGPVRVTAASGTSGAGRKADVALSHAEVHGDLRPYRVGNHQHVPEIAAGLSRAAGSEVGVTFVPHLAPLERGIAATVILAPAAGIDGDRVADVLERAYARAPFVRVLPAGALPSVRGVAGTPFCDLAVVTDPTTGDHVVLGAIDNLMKGAASQAVQVLNAVFDLDPAAGLLTGPASEIRHAAVRL